MSSTLFRTKTVEQSIQDTEEPEHALKKSLSALDLTVFGVGVIIGTGIFVLTGTVARSNAGPAVALAFVVAGVVCALAALCYAEFASTVPVAGLRVHLLVRLARRAARLDHRLGPGPGVRARHGGGRGRLVRLLRSLLDNAGWHLPARSLAATGDGFGFDLLAAVLSCWCSPRSWCSA